MKLLRRFSVRLSLLFLILLVVFSLMLLSLAQRSFEIHRVEIDQRVNRNLAADMALELQPELAKGKDPGDLGSLIHYMMVLNPAIEIYALDENGRILAFFAEPGREPQMDRVDLEPVHRFLDPTEGLPIYGDNPRMPSEPTHFSSAPLDLGAAGRGYLYVVLRSSLYEVAQTDAESSYLVATLRQALVVVVPVVALLGLIAFFFFTRRLDALTKTVRAFGKGSYSPRVATTSRDEIGELSASFNQMADTIEANLRNLKDADRARREIAASISHDLRNPLASIRGYTETLLQKDAELSPQERKKYLRISLDRAAALSRLIDGLFELSKLEAPGVAIQKERFSLAELVQDVVMQFSPTADERQVRLSAADPGELFFVHADLQMIERVLTNLIDNALRHSPVGGSVAIALSRMGDDEILCRVSDEGSGVPSELRDRVFERFFNGDASRGAPYKGSGLGLAIAKRIVTLHGGRIGVDAPADKPTGSSFFFVLPSDDAASGG